MHFSNNAFHIVVAAPAYKLAVVVAAAAVVVVVVVVAVACCCRRWCCLFPLAIIHCNRQKINPPTKKWIPLTANNIFKNQNKIEYYETQRIHTQHTHTRTMHTQYVANMRIFTNDAMQYTIWCFPCDATDWLIDWLTDCSIDWYWSQCNLLICSALKPKLIRSGTGTAWWCNIITSEKTTICNTYLYVLMSNANSSPILLRRSCLWNSKNPISIFKCHSPPHAIE